jgi:hypothetical protein
VTAHNNGFLNTSTFASVSVVPTGWWDNDLGAPGIGGSAVYAEQSGNWTVSGGGAGVANTGDQLNDAFEAVSGDGSLVSALIGNQYTNQYAEAGVMFRDSSTPGSMFVDLVATASGGITMQYRNSTGGAVSSTPIIWNLPAYNASNPLWLMIVKSSGNTYTGYYSISGSAWTQVGTATVNFTNSNYQYGMSVTAANNGALNTATFNGTWFYPGSY